LDQAKFAFERPEGLIDFSYRATHETTLASKALIKEFYGRLPRRSYWIGASTGGYQGLMEAQRFPADYDGILAGAPANNWTSQMAGMLNEILAVSRDSDSRLSDSALQILHRAVLSTCDTLDGVADGVLEDPRKCVFDVATLNCDATARPDECLTPSQLVAARRVYEGLKDSHTGARIFPGLSAGSEPLWGVWANKSNIQEIPISHFRWIVFADSTWDWRTFDFSDSKSYETVRQAEARLAPIMNATDPDLREFRRRGGKLIQWHGWADHVIAAENSINYYNSVLSFFNRTSKSRDQTRRDVQSFYRLFMVPGLSHRPPNASPASIAFDMQTALEDWVERGHPPERVVATYPTNGVGTHRTHPLCPYPAIAVYTGKGDVGDAASYSCGKRDTGQ